MKNRATLQTSMTIFRRIAFLLIVGLPGATFAQGDAKAPTPPTGAGAAAATTAATSIEVGLLATGERRLEVRPEATSWIMNEITSFTASHPAIKVETLNIDDQRDVKPIEACPALPRNVVGICSEPGYEVAYLVKRQEIVPIDKFLPDPEFDKGAFYDNLWEPVKLGGKTWGVPWATSVAVLLYQPDLFKKAGIAGPPRTWDEFLEDSEKLTQDTDGDGRIDQVGAFPLPATAVAYLAAIMLVQKGVPLISPEGFVPYSSQIEDAMALARKVIANPTAGRPTAPDLKYAMFITFTRSPGLSAFSNKKDYALAFLPTCGKEVQANFDTLYLAVRPGTPAQEAASWAFIKWISRRDAALPKALGGYPVRKDFIEREDFKALAATSYQDLKVLWQSNERLAEFGSYAVMGRFEGIRTLLKSVSGASGAPAAEVWNTTAKQLNANAKILKTSGGASYELFK